MNKKFLKHYMETEPEGTSKKYIFLVDNQDIAMNIVMSGYQALYLGQEDDEYYFSVNSFIEDMRSIQFHGTCQSAYHYVAACTTKWMNDQSPGPGSFLFVRKMHGKHPLYRNRFESLPV